MLFADECEDAGLDVIPLPDDIRNELKIKGIPIWDWIGNPLDGSILDNRTFTDVDMLQLMANSQNFDLIIPNMHEGALLTLGNQDRTTMRLRRSVEGYIKVKKEDSKPILVVLRENSPGIGDYDHWSSKLICELRSRLIEGTVPFYPTIGRAANSAKKLIEYYRKKRQ